MDDHPGDDVGSVVGPSTYNSSSQQPCSEIELNTLLDALPTQISYSFISLPDLKLARRDLFDARFQLISEGTGDPDFVTSQVPSDGSNSALEFIDNPSDLVPLVYEGGLKTWECSLDLAKCLKRDGHAANAKGKCVLELGCGTAMPTLCVLQELFASPTANDAETHIHLQDFNTSVLQLVTVPNILLAWYTSPAAAPYRSSEELHAPEDDPGAEVHITPELVQAFKTALHAYNLHLRFFSGSWHTFDLDLARARAGGSGVRYHVVVTSETIYHPEALPSLVRVLRGACTGGDGRDGDDRGGCLCLVAGKTVYFGVGGGVAEFVRSVESGVGRGRVETIWETSTGVSRRVMRVHWT